MQLRSMMIHFTAMNARALQRTKVIYINWQKLNMMFYENVPDLDTSIRIISLLSCSIHTSKKTIWINYNHVATCIRADDGIRGLFLAPSTRSFLGFDRISSICSDFMTRDQFLVDRIRTIFRNKPWCQTLYKNPNFAINTANFKQILKAAAAIYDQRQIHILQWGKTFWVGSNI